jgi:hypothetical protein
LHKFDPRIIPPHQRQHPRQQPLSRPIKDRILPQHLDTIERSIELADHVIHILPLLKETEPPLESQSRDNVKGVPLQPDRQIDLLPFEIPHRVHEELRALVNIRLVVAHIGHGEQGCYGGFDGLVDCWVACREHAVDGDVVEGGGKCIVEVCLRRKTFSSLDDRLLVQKFEWLMDDTHFHKLAPKAIDDWDGRRIRDGDVVGTHAHDRSVLLVQFTISGWSVAAADHEQAVQARELGQEWSW